MDREDEEVLAHLRAENEYLSESFAEFKPLEDELFEEIKSRIEETDISVPVRKGAWWYFERTREGLNYPLSCRVPALERRPHPAGDRSVEHARGRAVVILDENAEAGDSDYFSVGVLAVSPDDDWVASAPTSTATNCTTSRCVRSPASPPSPTNSTTSTTASRGRWTAVTSSTPASTTPSDRSNCGATNWAPDTNTDVLIYQEDDAQYNLSVGRSRDDAVIYVHLGSSMTTEVHYLDAHDPTGELTLLEGRRHGIEYGVEHFVDERGVAWWLKVTNEGATDFRLLAREVDGGEWREVIPERPGSRLDGVDAFKTFLAISERHDGGAAVRLVSTLGRRRPLRRRPARALEPGRGAGQSEHGVALGEPQLRHDRSCACR